MRPDGTYYDAGEWDVLKERYARDEIEQDPVTLRITETGKLAGGCASCACGGTPFTDYKLVAKGGETYYLALSNPLEGVNKAYTGSRVNIDGRTYFFVGGRYDDDKNGYGKWMPKGPPCIPLRWYDPENTPLARHKKRMKAAEKLHAEKPESFYLKLALEPALLEEWEFYHETDPEMLDEAYQRIIEDPFLSVGFNGIVGHNYNQEGGDEALEAIRRMKGG